jgi:hypothetical protein
MGMMLTLDEWTMIALFHLVQRYVGGYAAGKRR